MLQRRISSGFLLPAASYGGGLVAQEATLNVAQSEFLGNFADQFGGGIVQVATGSMRIESTTFDSNTAGEGGGALAIAMASKSDR